jgi:hypothetical protein
MATWHDHKSQSSQTEHPCLSYQYARGRILHLVLIRRVELLTDQRMYSFLRYFPLAFYIAAVATCESLASTEKQWGSRAAHVTAKAMSGGASSGIGTH